MVGNLGNAFQPYIGALIITSFGWNTLFVVLAGAYLVAGSMWVFIDPNRPFYESHAMPQGFEAIPAAVR